MKRKIHLHGRLKKAFGASFEFEVATAGEAIRALNANFPGAFLRELEIGSYRLIRGKRHGGFELALDHVNVFNLGGADLHIVPAAEGAASGKGGGAIKLILGVALIGAAIFFSGGTLAAPLAGMGTAIPGLGGATFGTMGMLGVALAVAGISQMIAPKQETKKADQNQNYSFSGPANSSEQGVARALIYGDVICGSATISTALDIEDRNSPVVVA